MNDPLHDPELLRRAQDLFHLLCELDTAEQERALAESCGSDAELRMAVEALLKADRVVGDALSDAVIDAGAGPEAIPEFERFEIVREIGRGGMGIVYEARQFEPKRSVAIKMLRGRAGGAGQRARIRREAQVLARIQHPCIAVVLESGEHRGSPYIVMELVDGVGIADAVAKLALEQKLEVIARIAEAMHHAHQKGIIHRDLKPDNILAVQESDGSLPTPKVLDFGIAHAIEPHANLTETLAAADGSGELLGTLAYMSPEQLEGQEDIDVRADVYALGIIAYELLTGQEVLDLSSTPVVSAIRRAADHVPARAGTLRSELRGDIEIILATAIEKNRDRRYQSASGFAQDIRRYLKREPILARPPTLRYQASRFAARNRGLVGGLAAAVVAVGVGIILTALFASSEYRQRRATEQLLYGSIVSNAASSLREGDVHTARSLLKDADARLRGWEWHFLDRASSVNHVRVETGLTNAEVVPSESGEGFRVVGGRNGGCFSIEVDHDGRLSEPVSFGIQFDEETDRLFVDRNGQVRIADIVAGVIRSTASSEVLVGRQVPFQCAPSAGIGYLEDGDLVLTSVFYYWRRAPVCQHPALGRIFAAYSSDGSECVAIASAETGRVLHTLSPAIQCSEMAWGDAGSLLFGADLSGRVLACDPLTGETVWGPTRAGGAPCTVVRYVSETSTLLCGFLDGSVAVIDADTGMVVRREAASDDQVVSIAVDEDTGEVAVLDTGGVMSIFHLGASRTDILVGHKSWVNPLAISRDGSTLISGAWDGNIRVWDARTGEPRAVIAMPPDGDMTPAVLELAVSQDGAECVAVSVPRFGQRATVHRVDLATGQVVSSVTADRVGRVYPAFDEGGDLHLFGPVSRAEAIGAAHREIDIGGWNSAYPVQQNPNRCVFAGLDSMLVVASLKDGVVKPLNIKANAEARFVAMGPDGRTVAFGASPGAVDLRDAEGRRPPATLRGHTGEVLSIAWSPNGERVATASRDGTVGIWDAHTNELLVRLHGHEDYVFDVLWSPDGSMLYSSSGDGTIRLWRGQD